jgi:3-oxoadipate enol-lactonase
MPYVDAPGARLYFETDGSPDAPALLFIHAGIANLRMWDPQIPTLSKDHYVIRFDERGFGLTEAEDVPFTDRADALAVLDHLGVSKATALGCSRGGTIAIDLTIDAPDRVVGLVTIGSGPAGHPDIEETAHEAELWEAAEAASGTERLRLQADLWDIGPLRDEADLDPEFVATARKLNTDNIGHIDENHRGGALEPSAWDRLGEIRVPTLLMRGVHDVSVIEPQFESMLERISSAEGYVFAEAAHIPSVEQPAEFEAVLTGWLTSHGL